MGHAVGVHLALCHVVHVQIVNVGVKLCNIAAGKTHLGAHPVGDFHQRRLVGNLVQILVEPPAQFVQPVGIAAVEEYFGVYDPRTRCRNMLFSGQGNAGDKHVVPFGGFFAQQHLHQGFVF